MPNDVLIECGVWLVIALVAFGLGVSTGVGAEIDPRKGIRTLRVNPWVRGGSILSLVAAVGIPVACLIHPPRELNDRIAVAVVVVLLAFFGGGGLLEASRCRVVLSSEGIGVETWYGKPKFIAWGEVESVDQRGFDGNYVVRAKSGTKIVLAPWLLDSFELFVEACRKHLAPDQCPKWFWIDPNG